MADIEKVDPLLEYRTKAGWVLHLRRVASRHIARIVAKHSIPDPPTYTFIAAGGEEVTREHDAKSLETPDDYRDWAKYTEVKIAAVKAQNLAVIKFLIWQCVIDEPPPPEEWSIDWKLWDIPMPDTSDPVDYKMEWLESEVSSDADDYSNIITRLYLLGGLIREDAAENYAAFFRATLERLTAA